MMSAIHFRNFFPGVPSYNYMFMLEAMTYKVSVCLDEDTDPEDVVVEAWTNQSDRSHPSGEWHGVLLEYTGPNTEQPGEHFYGHSEIITSDRDFHFTFRTRLSSEQDWTWSHGWQQNGFSHVEPPRPGDKWTLGPDFTHILSSLHCGNFLAATNAQQCGFTHVLNVADNLDMVYKDDEKVTYNKVAMRDGAHNSIEIHLLKEAVDWLLLNDNAGHKMLVNCRAGIGRAGSVTVGFVFAKCPDMTYEQAYEFVYSRRFVYPHAMLKEQLLHLYRHS